MRHTVLALLFVTCVLGQAVVPETPAGKVLTEWLAAFNSGDPARIRAFEETYKREAHPLARRWVFANRQAASPYCASRRASHFRSSRWCRRRTRTRSVDSSLALSSEDPPKIVSSPLRAIPRPPDLAIPRMSQEGALRALLARAEEFAKNDQFSGAVLVARHGKVLLHKVWGCCGPRGATPVTLDTQFRLGSMNKMFTADRDAAARRSG